MRSDQHTSPNFFKTYNAAVHDYEQRMSAAWARALPKPGSQQRHQSWFEGVSSAARAISYTSSSAVSTSSKSSSTHIHTADGTDNNVAIISITPFTTFASNKPPKNVNASSAILCTLWVPRSKRRIYF